MTAREVLQRCPFCGGEAIHVTAAIPKHARYVMCIRCNNTTAMTDTSEQAAGLWNARAYLAQPEAEAARSTARKLVDEQAEDDGLWFEAETAPEAYLQAALRKLHAAVEEGPSPAQPEPPLAHQPSPGGKRYVIDYGLACGRHWMSIDGKVIAQTNGDDVYLLDEDVVRLVKGTIGAPEWK